MNPFYDNERIFYNTLVQSDINKQKMVANDNFIQPLNLGQHIPYHKFNQFRQLYGDPDYSRQYPVTNIQQPIEANKEFWNVHTIPYTLNATKNKLVDISGTYYYNRDLPVISNRM